MMRAGRLIALFIGLICNVGCLSPIALNTIGTAGSYAPVAFNNLGGGQGESFWVAKYDDVVTATLRAGDTLSLEVKDKKIENSQTFLRFCDAKEERIDLFIVRRSDTVTSIKFDAGWFGSVAFGRLMARQIIFELDKAGDFLEDWTSMKHN
ncbi:MAG: DUF3568 family protein [Desulfobacterales bacterium]|jgi:hypothetical protein